MNEQEHSFHGRSFLQKEAVDAKTLFRGVKDTVQSAKNGLGTVRLRTPEEKANIVRREHEQGGTGSFAIDLPGWAAKKWVPGAKEKIEPAMGTYRGGLENFSQKWGGRLAGNNPNSLRYKFMSRATKVDEAEHLDDAGNVSSLYRDTRTPSLFAPVENTVKFTTPFLATAYVADKLYPQQDNNLGENVNQATYEPELQKSSSLFDISVSEQMDKKASMQKIAELEEQLEKYSEELEIALMDKKAAIEQWETAMMEKQSMEKRAAIAEQNLLEKQAEHEELRLRTIAQKRSKVAVDLAEEMLENKLIKQAQYQGTVDKLMECDESTIKMYESLVKEARTGSDSLETLSYFNDYKGNEKLVAAPDLAKNGLSKRGQTMGEAARDLTK